MTGGNVDAVSCDIACSRIYAPICGRPIYKVGPLRKFNSECMMSLYNCENPNDREYKYIIRNQFRQW